MKNMLVQQLRGLLDEVVPDGHLPTAERSSAQDRCLHSLLGPEAPLLFVEPESLLTPYAGYGVKSAQGRSKHMEDSYSVQTKLSSPGVECASAQIATDEEITLPGASQGGAPANPHPLQCRLLLLLPEKLGAEPTWREWVAAAPPCSRARPEARYHPWRLPSTHPRLMPALAGFSEDLALFSVFDGHGGNEVAEVRPAPRRGSSSRRAAMHACAW